MVEKVVRGLTVRFLKCLEVVSHEKLQTHIDVSRGERSYAAALWDKLVRLL